MLIVLCWCYFSRLLFSQDSRAERPARPASWIIACVSIIEPQELQFATELPPLVKQCNALITIPRFEHALVTHLGLCQTLAMEVSSSQNNLLQKIVRRTGAGSSKH
jgi:hypothetical protein